MAVRPLTDRQQVILLLVLMATLVLFGIIGWLPFNTW